MIARRIACGDCRGPKDPGRGHKWCADCRSKRREVRRTRNRGIQAHGLRRYGLTVAEYEALSLAQGDVCAMCQQPCRTGQRLSVDHDHRSGLVRGLLCRRCNAGLGYIEDDVWRRNAERYLGVCEPLLAEVSQ